MGRLSRPAAFLDRDGTINVSPGDHEYITSGSDFEWLPGAREGMVRLARGGFVLAIVSNQRGVGLGLVPRTVLREIEELIQTELARCECQVEGFRYCFHDVGESCACRKPRPGLLLDLSRQLNVDLSRSWMIGDMDSDVLAGSSAGCRTALIGSQPRRARPDLVAPSLDAVSKRITSHMPDLTQS